MPPRRRLPSCARGSDSSGGRPGSRRGCTAWWPTPAATWPSASAAAGTNRWTPWPRRRRARCPRTLAVQREQRARAARRAWRTCLEDQRQVLVMKDVLSLSYEEIAAAMEMPVGTVKCHAHRGRLRMRDAMAPSAAGGGPVIPAAPLDREGIRAIIPHREPFLLLDEVTRARARRARQGQLSRASPTTGTSPATSPATRSCPACCRSRRWPSSARSAASPTPTSPASSRCSPASTTSASSASSARATCSTWSARSTACGARSARPTRRPASRGELACRATLTFALTTSRRRVITACRQGVEVLGVGAFAPERVMTNDELATRGRDQRRVDREPHGYPRAPGRRRRAVAAELGCEAARRALDMAGVDPSDLGLIVVATASPDYYFPATAALIGERLGAAERRRLRPLGRVHRVRVRAGAGLRPGRRRGSSTRCS